MKNGLCATDHAAGLEYAYTFDTAGNVLSAVKHPTGGGSDSTRTYHYDNASGRDLLTSITIDGTTKSISYPHDIRGNVTAGTPLSWYNGESFTLTWGKGTQLASAKKGLALKTSYTYDIAGVRSSKTVGTTKYSFTTLSGLVMRQEWGARQMDFVYDENNQPYALSYKSGKNVTPVMYYYLLNQQGDVEALMDANGAIVATYEYDPWGAVTVKNANGALDNDDTSIGNMNPLRYRGYYYDNETGFYYLESRYYDPVVGRFISADTFATTDCNGFLSANMFAYCENNPVNFKDPNGEELWGALIGAAVGALSSVATQLIFSNGKVDPSQVAVSAVCGAAAGLGLPYKSGEIIMGAFTGFLDSAYSNIGEDMSLGEQLLEAVVGAGMGALASYAGFSPSITKLSNSFKDLKGAFKTFTKSIGKGVTKMFSKLGKSFKMLFKFSLNFVRTTFKGMPYSGLSTFTQKMTSLSYRYYTSG